MDHNAVFKLPRSDQSSSVLFSLVPGEVRDKIFTYALLCHEDLNRLWDKDTLYVRPGYAARQTCDTALLQTCQRVFVESVLNLPHEQSFLITQSTCSHLNSRLVPAVGLRSTHLFSNCRRPSSR
jgi:hypothetical protein